MKVEKFWKWFLEANERLIMFDDLQDFDKERLIHEFDHHLKEYSEGLTFDIGEQTANGRSLVFSSEGDAEYFEDIVTLVENAPVLDWWDFIAFKQPQGEEVKVEYEQLFFDSKKMYFLPLENDEELHVLGLRVALPDFDEKNEDLLIGAYITLESQIGEFDAATLIGYLEVGPIPEQADEEEWIPLTKFPEFIDWFKKEKGLE